MGFGPIKFCFIKNLTGVACPSCGSTRAIHAILQGDFWYAFQINPLGYIIIVIMLMIPSWMIWDFLKKSSSFYNFYHSVQKLMKKPLPIFFLLTAVIVNWVFILLKGHT
jgi:hypothetical protein